MKIKGNNVGNMEHTESGEVYSITDVLNVEKNGL